MAVSCKKLNDSSYNISIVFEPITVDLSVDLLQEVMEVILKRSFPKHARYDYYSEVFNSMVDSLCKNDKLIELFLDILVNLVESSPERMHKLHSKNDLTGISFFGQTTTKTIAFYNHMFSIMDAVIEQNKDPVMEDMFNNMSPEQKMYMKKLFEKNKL